MIKNSVLYGILIVKPKYYITSIYIGFKKSMTDFENKIINNITVETVTNTIINETAKWGFKAADYIRLVNAIMDLSLIKEKKDIVIEESDRS